MTTMSKQMCFYNAILFTKCLPNPFGVKVNFVKHGTI